MNLKSISLWYLLFSLGVLILAVIVSAVLNNWSIVYAVLLLAPSLLLVESLSLFNIKIINKQIGKWTTKKKIIITSIGLYILKSLLLMLPFSIGLLIDFYVDNIFNIYMMIAFLCVSLVVFSSLFFLDSKNKLKIFKKKKGESENGPMNE